MTHSQHQSGSHSVLYLHCCTLFFLSKPQYSCGTIIGTFCVHRKARWLFYISGNVRRTRFWPKRHFWKTMPSESGDDTQKPSESSGRIRRQCRRIWGYRRMCRELLWHCPAGTTTRAGSGRPSGGMRQHCSHSQWPRIRLSVVALIRCPSGTLGSFGYDPAATDQHSRCKSSGRSAVASAQSALP